MISPATALPVDLTQTPLQDLDARERSRRLSLQGVDPPGQVPGYEILSPLGEGSFGSVWLARELKTGKQVAIKFYTQRRGLDWSLLSREVEKLAVLYTSRNIVGLLDVGWDHEPPYFVMEYLESGSLEKRLQSGSIPVEDAVRIAKAIARALVHAHGSGILHCDLKPANVLLDANFEPRLGDFGQSRLTTEQSPAFGTVFYMAPEQAVTDGVPDARWDVYALGAVLYHMITGAPPYFSAASEARLRAAKTLEDRLKTYREIVLNSPLPDLHRQNAGVDHRLAEIIDGCLQRDPAERYSNPQVVLDLLEERDQVRAKRPLIALGFLGPILFLFAMYWIAESAVPRIVAAAENNLIDRALDSDVVSGRILARSVQQELVSRQATLERLADAPELRQLIAAAKGLSAEKLVALSAGDEGDENPAALYRWMNERGVEEHQHLADERRTPDESWFVTDDTGRQLYRVPTAEPGRETTIGRSFHWRDYFHNQGHELDSSIPASSVPPRTKPGVSIAFRSQATDQYMVAIAVPIWDESHTRVAGVLARTIHLTELLKQWEVGLMNEDEEPSSSSEDDLSRFLVLADTRGGDVRLLDHPWMTREHLRTLQDQPQNAELSLLKLDPREAETLLRNHRTRAYADPIGKVDRRFAGEWLAAAAPVGKTGWLAIVQERREVTVRPVDELRRVFVRAGLSSLGIFALLLALLWYLIHRAST